MSLFPQQLLDLHDELIVDLFAGGGGASSGIEEATGRMVDIAVNHDATAVEMHRANHPQTQHYQSDVFEVEPRLVTQGRPVGLLWASPDCTYHSKARGSKPIRDAKKKRRALAWVVTRWAGQVRPKVIMLENVEEFAKWGPLRGPKDNLKPCPKRKGKTFRRWVKSLTDLGYRVEWKELRACDYGTPTIRKRLFLIARGDGQPIVWPEATHVDPAKVGKNEKELAAFFRKNPHLRPWRAIAECIDWTIPMLSIFATKDEAKEWAKFHGVATPVRPLADKSMSRIARGVRKFVLDNPKPYLVTLTHSGSRQPGWIDEPITTITGAHRDEVAVVQPCIVSTANQKSTGRGPAVWDSSEPLRTITSTNPFAVVGPFVAGVGGRQGQSPERGIDQPMQTVTSKADSVLVAPFTTPRYGEREGQEPRCGSVEVPSPVIVPGANGSSICAANLVSYHSAKGEEARGSLLHDVIPTIDTQNRFAVCASFLGQYRSGFAEGNSDEGHSLEQPVSTISTKGPHQAVISAFMDQANGGYENRVGRPVDEPISTILTEGRGHQGLIAAHVQRDFGQSVGSDASEPVGTITGSGNGKAGVVAAFLAKYYGTTTGQGLDEPSDTLTSKDRFGLVTVKVGNEFRVINDIGMRMLQPKELYLAQGFRKSYIFDHFYRDGKRVEITKTEQVKMCGNSVCPPMAKALVTANCPQMIVRRAA